MNWDVVLLSRIQFAFTISFHIGGLAGSFWPYMVPYSVTIADGAAPPASLRFLFYGAGLFVIPTILAYTAVVYWIFRGKVHEDAYSG